MLNEHISSTVSIFLSLYTKLFNLIFDTGVIPDEWLTGIVKPIFKNKGDPTQPENYRPITLLRCLGKLFTSILCKRLELYAKNLSLNSECQTGFRKGCSTLDNILSLHFLMNLVMSAKKKLFVLLLISNRRLILFGEMAYSINC